MSGLGHFGLYVSNQSQSSHHSYGFQRLMRGCWSCDQECRLALTTPAVWNMQPPYSGVWVMGLESIPTLIVSLGRAPHDPYVPCR